MRIPKLPQVLSRPASGPIFATCSLLALAGCDESGSFSMDDIFKPKPENEEAVQTDADGEFIEKDVEAPDVFSVQEAGLWDGRPSLGGVWVAHPDVKEPERVMIRNQANGKFVVGALFRRERANPGPRLQVSSDAAQSLDILAGSPVELSVVALRKERIPVAPPEPVEVIELEEEPEPVRVIEPGNVEIEPVEIKEQTLDPIEAAGAAIDAAEPTPVISRTSQAPAVQSTLPVSRLKKPYIQVGIFSVEENAKRASNQMRSAGLVPTTRAQEASGQPFWRVLVGPAGSASEQSKLLDKIKAQGYSDAYAVAS